MLLILALAIGVTGCTKITPINVEWVPVAGSRADATVELSYAYNPLVNEPIVNEEQALELAKKRCNAWGYSDVEAFGGQKSGCNRSYYDALSRTNVCTSIFVNKTFQCTGRGDAEIPTKSPAAGVGKKK
jgi:hypothetical protein